MDANALRNQRGPEQSLGRGHAPAAAAARSDTEGAPLFAGAAARLGPAPAHLDEPAARHAPSGARSSGEARRAAAALVDLFAASVIAAAAAASTCHGADQVTWRRRWSAAGELLWPAEQRARIILFVQH